MGDGVIVVVSISVNTIKGKLYVVLRNSKIYKIQDMKENIFHFAAPANSLIFN